jgi:hypothetical protein
MVSHGLTSANGVESKGGAYAHLTKGSQRKVFQKMEEKTNFNRESVFVDVGGGINVTSLHAAVGYCGYAVSIEIDERRVLEGGQLTLKYLETQGSQARNFRVALIAADVLDCLPLNYATHVFVFDLVFAPQVWLQIIQWLAKSTCEFIVLFKPARWPSYFEYVKEQLGAEEIARVRNLKMAISGEGCTAVILDPRRLETLQHHWMVTWLPRIPGH